MKKKLALLLSISLIFIMTASLAEGFLPPLNELFDTEMPSMENALQQEADQKETLPDGSVRMVFLNCGRNEYNACSEYLGTSGCQVVNTTREGKAITAVLEKEGRSFTFSYDAGQETVTVVYPPRTFAEAFVLSFRVGDIVTFGTYPQTAEGNDHTPIEWIVLERNDQKALLISRYGLDVQPYNTKWRSVTWETSTLRAWLNETFMKKAFTDQEQSNILLTMVDNGQSQGYGNWDTNGGNDTQDRIFLLSFAEANEYFNVTYEDGKNINSRAAPTAYAKEQGASTSSIIKTADGNEAGIWRLRSPGSGQKYAACVLTGGSLGARYVHLETEMVRPALWISLKSKHSNETEGSNQEKNQDNFVNQSELDVRERSV